VRLQRSSAVFALLLAACSAEIGVGSQGAEPVPTTISVPDSAPQEPPDDSATPGTSGSDTIPALVETGDGAGDPLFPDLGNPGVDVTHYDITLAYDPMQDTLVGSVDMAITLTSDRSAITLDSLGPESVSVTVDGLSVPSQLDGPELRIPFTTQRRRGEELSVEVKYSLRPQAITGPDGLSAGWFNTDAGSWVLNEPAGARTWLPCNDHPSDKATYRFAITVPDGLTAVANGTLDGRRSVADATEWVWQQRDPMATYLILLITGDYELIEGTGPGGLPLLSAVPTGTADLMEPYLASTPPMIEFFEQHFGRYPLDGYGLAITDSFGGLAMETQGRSMFSGEDFPGPLGGDQQAFLSHELAHQWFGDAVTPARWQDIWLNESFATYGEWMWMEEAGFETVQAAADRALAGRPPGSTADPGRYDLFGYNSYPGGAVVLHALRRTIGDGSFFELLQRWVADNSGTSRTTQDFTALAEAVTGRSLTAFFDEWLFAVQPPGAFPDANT